MHVASEEQHSWDCEVDKESSAPTPPGRPTAALPGGPAGRLPALLLLECLVSPAPRGPALLVHGGRAGARPRTGVEAPGVPPARGDPRECQCCAPRGEARASHAHYTCTPTCVCTGMHGCTRVHSCHITPSALMGISVQREGQARTQAVKTKAWVQTPQILSKKRELSGTGKGAWRCRWEWKLVQLLWRREWRLLGKLKIELPYDPEPLLGIYPGKTILSVHTHPSVHSGTVYGGQDMGAASGSTDRQRG